VKGKVLKGGIPDKVAAGKAVLKDWNTGKIPFYVPPPTENDGHIVKNSAVVLSGFSADFDLAAMDETVLKENGLEEEDFVAMQDGDKAGKGLFMAEDEEEESDEGDNDMEEESGSDSEGEGDMEDYNFGKDF